MFEHLYNTPKKNVLQPDKRNESLIKKEQSKGKWKRND